jgi:hypothetical protein
MKKIAKVLGITFCLALAFLFLQKPLKAEAATTFKATWSTSMAKWGYSSDGGYWTEGKDYVENGMKDGDVLVIDGVSASTEMLTLNINARVGELAVCGKATASVTAKGVDTAYAVNDGSTLIVTSNVKKLIANYGATAQVIGNVDEVLGVYKEGNKIGLGITGTVGKANVYFAPDSWTQKTVYNVAAGKFDINDKNFFVTDAKYYSLTPTAGSNGKKELDKVPKTGGRFEDSVLFFLIAAGLVVAGISLNKKRNVNL